MSAEDRLERIRHALARAAGDTSDFELNPDVHLPPGRRLRPAGVLVPLVAAPGGGLAVILTKRSSALRHHPGQIAFPGGKVDAGDSGPVAAALREASEEIGLPPGQAEILGMLDPHETVTGFRITPVVAHLRHPFEPRPEPGEVDEVFAVPLGHLLDRANYRIESRLWRGRRRRYYVVPYGPHYIWGATARMLRALAERLSP